MRCSQSSPLIDLAPAGPIASAEGRSPRCSGAWAPDATGLPGTVTVVLAGGQAAGGPLVALRPFGMRCPRLKALLSSSAWAGVLACPGTNASEETLVCDRASQLVWRRRKAQQGELDRAGSCFYSKASLELAAALPDTAAARGTERVLSSSPKTCPGLSSGTASCVRRLWPACPSPGCSGACREGSRGIIKRSAIQGRQL